MGRIDLDHVVPHGEGGASDCDNPVLSLPPAPRLKTHAPGCTSSLDADGALLVTTPSGATRIS